MNVNDYQLKSNRCSYGSTYLNSLVTTNKQYTIDSQKLKRKELKHTAREKNLTTKGKKKKELTKKNYKNNLKTRIKVTIIKYQSTATLNVCGLDAQIKRHRVAKTSLASLYTNNEKSERIIIETI